MKYTEHSEVLAGLQSHVDNDYELRIHSQECIDHCYLSDGQWEQSVWNANSNNPRYTYDITTPMVDQAVRAVSEADFSIRISPDGGKADEKTAEVLDGIMRKIQNASGSKYVFNDAAKMVHIGGFSGWRVVAEYANAESFDQDFFIKPVPDWINRVWLDMGDTTDDGSGSRFAYVLYYMSCDDYEERWPDGKKSSIAEPLTSTRTTTKDLMIVCEFLYWKTVTTEIVLLSNGAVYRNDEKFKQVKDDLLRSGLKIINSKKIKEKRWYSRFLDNGDWLEEAKETPFKSCPIIPEYANFTVVSGSVKYRGEVSRLLDPARNLNYVLSRQVAEGALAPRAKYWMTKEQAKDPDIRADLETLNTNHKPVQFFNFDANNPAVPQQNGGAVVNQGLQLLADTMMGVVGKISSRHEAAMGENPALQSGYAINQLAQRSDIADYKCLQWHAKAIERTGKVILEAIPVLFDSSNRDYRLEYEDGSNEFVRLNEPVVDAQTGQTIVLNDLSRGSYSVTCEAGASFANRQDQTISFLLELGSKDPETLALSGDLLAGAFNFPAARTLSERKRARMVEQGLIPFDQLTEEEQAQQQQKGQNPQPDPNMVLAMAEMKKAEADMLGAQNAQAELQLRAMEMQAKLADSGQKNAIGAGRLDVEEFNAETKRFEAVNKAENEGQMVDLKVEGSALENATKIQTLMTPRQF